MAAGDQVGFLASTAATLRGLNVYVGAVTEATGDGEAKNTGIIEAK